MSLIYHEVSDRLSKPGLTVAQLLDDLQSIDRETWDAHPDLYPKFVDQLLEKGLPGLSLDLAREGLKHFKADRPLRYKLALAAARAGNPLYAAELIDPLVADATGPEPAADMGTKLRVDVLCLKGRTFKDQSRNRPEMAARSAEWYEQAAGLPGAGDLPDAGTYPLVNAATMRRVAGDVGRAEAHAGEVVRRMGGTVGHAAAEADLWLALTMGEALMMLGRTAEAVGWYRTAIRLALAADALGSLLQARNNLGRLADAGVTVDCQALDELFGRVVVFSGHMVDSPEDQRKKKKPRFPNNPALADAVQAAIRAELDRLNAKVGYCSLAGGSDILFAEAMLDRKAELHVLLPFDTRDFWRTSVDFGQEGPHWQHWLERYQRVVKRIRKPEESDRQSPARLSTVQNLTAGAYLGSDELFALTNAALQGQAALRARQMVGTPTAVVVIDRAGGPAAVGGTADFVSTWEAAGFPCREIDLAPLRAAHPAAGPADKPVAPPSGSPLKRPVRAVLFADVAGYSDIDEWKLPRFLTEYAEFLRQLFGSPAGKSAVYANTWGDGLYVVFDGGADAAEFALGLVDPANPAAPNWDEYELGSTCPIRVGLHVGPVFELPDVFQKRPQYAGTHVTRAARIEPVTVRGCVYASETFAALLTMQAGKRFTAESVGLHPLAKNYDRCQLYRVYRAGE